MSMARHHAGDVPQACKGAHILLAGAAGFAWFYFLFHPRKNNLGRFKLYVNKTIRKHLLTIIRRRSKGTLVELCRRLRVGSGQGFIAHA
jgi:hypothetical protein